MKKSILDLKLGQKARFLGFKSGFLSFQSKLMALGLLPGVELTLVRAAPFGDPLEIRFLSTDLCLRKQECSVLEIENLLLES